MKRYILSREDNSTNRTVYFKSIDGVGSVETTKSRLDATKFSSRNDAETEGRKIGFRVEEYDSGPNMYYLYKISFKVAECRIHKSLETLEKCRELATVISSGLDVPVKICKRVNLENRYQVIEMWSHGEKQDTLKGANL